MLKPPPDSLKALFELYYERYKPLYNRIQNFNEMPVELVFEVAAAWDHLSRHWKYDEPEQACIDKASRHIKRAVFDAYKLLLKHTVDEYRDLRKIDTHLIDNGDFDRNLRSLMHQIRADAQVARMAEGNSSAAGWDDAFEKWDLVFENMERFNAEFLLSPKVDWARGITSEFSWKRRKDGFILGFLSGIAGTVVFGFATWFVSWLMS